MLAHANAVHLQARHSCRLFSSRTGIASDGRRRDLLLGVAGEPALEDGAGARASPAPILRGLRGSHTFLTLRRKAFGYQLELLYPFDTQVIENIG
jgi:hypothetical protein